ncbi:hypothetical protein R3W88_030552 [Solanum pinnatisectum]|uniref:Uncharacterized protein n=1 Tax=Solanum pinnatisectum TaxID=50273 RepID=A0AAV9LIU5_9SOLN|nr:hypothetical protein R3W88_030552 [Solanum pinnatisectum]
MLGIPNFPPSTINRKPKDEINDDVRLDDDWMPKDDKVMVPIYRPRKKRGSGRFNNGSVDAIKYHVKAGQIDVAAESPWEIKEEKSENQGSSTDHDPLTVSFFSFQVAVARGTSINILLLQNKLQDLLLKVNLRVSEVQYYLTISTTTLLEEQKTLASEQAHARRCSKHKLAVKFI